MFYDNVCITSDCCLIDNNDKFIDELINYNIQFGNITDKQIKHTLDYINNTNEPVIFFQILNNSLLSSFQKTDNKGIWDHRYNIIASEILSILDTLKVPDTVFSLYFSDGVGLGNKIFHDLLNDNDHMPIFTFSRDLFMKNHKMFPLFPDDYTIGNGNIEDDYFSGIETKMIKIIRDDIVPFEQKIPEIIWRGKNTGDACHCNEVGNFSQGCLETPKYSVVQIGRKYQYLNAAFAAPREDFINKCDKTFNTSTDNYLSPFSLLSYKYQMSIDGIRTTYPGLILKLFMRAVVFKINGTNSIKGKSAPYWEQWFYPSIKSYVYEIDSTTIEQQLQEIALSLDDKAGLWKNKAEKSRNFALKNLNICRVKQYIFEVIKQCSHKMSSSIMIRKKIDTLEKVTDEVRDFQKKRIEYIHKQYRVGTDLKVIVNNEWTNRSIWSLLSVMTLLVSSTLLKIFYSRFIHPILRASFNKYIG